MSMKTIREPNVTKRVKVEESKLFVETTIHNEPVLENNQSHRLNGTFRQNDKVGLQLDGARVIHVLQVNETEWNLFKRKQPDLYRSLHSKDQITREAAAAKIKRAHPEWFIETPRIFSPSPRVAVSGAT
jgi:hypothetical protein